MRSKVEIRKRIHDLETEDRRNMDDATGNIYDELIDQLYWVLGD